jgi:hypothetical protein
MAGGLKKIPLKSREELKQQRDVAEGLFRELRKEEGPKVFAAACEEVRPTILHVLAATDDLLSLDGNLFRREPSLWQVLRYFCAPPVSEEDLWTLVGGPKFKLVPSDYADATARAITDVLDPVRFPWVARREKPSERQIEAAVLATTTLMANRAVGTNRRGEASTRQEGLVARALENAGYIFDPSRSAVEFLDTMTRGTFSRERKVAAAKCDVPTRLRDGRLLAIECKVSNGPKNGWKRVNREVGGKSSDWKNHFGSQIITGVVLAGVFDLSCLIAAQDQDVLVFWEHDLDELTAVVSSLA